MGMRLALQRCCGFVATFMAASCGTIGVELLDLDRDAGEGGTSNPPISLDASMSDASDAEDGGVDADAMVDAAGPDAFVDTGPQPCDFSGTWATKVEVALSWNAKTVLGFPAVLGGNGTAHVWVKHRSAPDGSVEPGSMVACGVSLPPIALGSGAGGGSGRVSFDIPLFDTAPPSVSTDPLLQVHGAGFPGDPSTLSETAMLLGVTLSDPLNDAWPGADVLMSHDLDGDGHPGVTLPHLGGEYVHLPVALFGATRSEAGHYAARVVLSASGTVLSCEEIAGEAQVRRLDSRVLGCVVDGGSLCSTAQSDLLEDNRPDFIPGDGTYRAVKVSEDDVPCQAIRTALP